MFKEGPEEEMLPCFLWTLGSLKTIFLYMVCNPWKTLTSFLSSYYVQKPCAFLGGIQIKLTRLTKTHTENLESKQVPKHHST